jgi:site-specific DNA-methyltransferase (adenine-specific)
MVSSQLICADCLVAMKDMADDSVDSIVTDPPYGLEFMGKKWDYDVPSVEIWEECFRVLKPGGYLLCFGGSRTYHRVAVNIEDAGFFIRDQIMWLYGSGFPKSHNVSKAIDKAAGMKRTEVIGTRHRNVKPFDDESGWNKNNTQGDYEYKAPATPEAKQWDGWGTALKPAHEPIVMARKPIEGTVAENVLEHGTGAINVDGCRITYDKESFERNQKASQRPPKEHEKAVWKDTGHKERRDVFSSTGRFPANVILDEEAGAMLDEQAPSVGNMMNAVCTKDTRGGTGHTLQRAHKTGETSGHFDGLGGASRFFYCAKPSQKERNAGCEHLPEEKSGKMGAGMRSSVGRPNEGTTLSEDRKSTNHHPTVKPVDLMRYLCRLVTPPEGIVLDPFMGSGTTGIAANLEGFNFIGIDMEEEYVEIARARIAHSGEYVITEDLTMKRIKQPTLFDFTA